MSIKIIVAISSLLVSILVGYNLANATMPRLTPKPTNPSPGACKAWAKKQSDDAIEMWGIQEDGTSSRNVAIDRLARSCMGQRPPEIVGFSSSAGFDDGYCKKHFTATICKGLAVEAAPGAIRDCQNAYAQKQYLDAESCWRAKAQKGDLEAQFQLGKLYYQGEETSADKKQAAAWFTTAAERGNVSAQSFLALMYLNGDGVSQSPEIAIKWYEAAARGGDLSAAQNLAFHYRQGRLLPHDPERSLYWCNYYVDRQRKDDLPLEFRDGCEKWLKQTN